MKISSLTYLILILVQHYESVFASTPRDMWHPQLKVNPYTRSLYLMPIDVSHRTKGTVISSTGRYILESNSNVSVTADEKKNFETSKGEVERGEESPSPATASTTSRILTTPPELLFSGGGRAVMSTKRGGNYTESRTTTKTSTNIPNVSKTKSDATSKKSFSSKGISSSSNALSVLEDSGADNAALYAKRLKVS
jgi:hypothetical protein